MSDIRKSLESLADSIEKIQNQPAPKPKILDRELSGNKINGGVITNFSSVGIKDEAGTAVVVVKNDGIHVDVVYTSEIANNLTIRGDLKVLGEVSAEKLHVNEITSDVRNERTSPLEFKGNDTAAYGQGLIWTGGSYTKQMVLRSDPDRIWSSESIDLHRDKSYFINGVSVIDSESLGNSITQSNLTKVGKLRELKVSGHVEIDNFVRYNADTEQFSIGAADPNGMFSIESFDHQFLIDPTDDKNWKIGTWTTSGINVVTDDTVRIQIENNGKIQVNSKTSFDKPIGIGVKNFEDDCHLTVAGAVRFQNAKQERLADTPESGYYLEGDIVWNNKPKPTGFVGWVCVREGTPGEWKAFGQISA